jgi:hypothetical protein
MTGSLLRALVTRNRWLLARPAARATGLAPLAGLRWFSSGRLVSAGSARAGWSPLVQLGPAGLRWFSSGRAIGLAPQLGSGHWSPAGLRWFSSGRATGLSPQLGSGHWSPAGLRCVRLLHSSVSWWLVRRSRAALVSAAHFLSAAQSPARANSTGIRLLSSVPQVR